MQHLKAANQYRAVRAKCMPLFELARGWSPDVQESIYRTMVCHIAATLNVEASAYDLNLEQWFPVEPKLIDASTFEEPNRVEQIPTLDALRFIRGGEAA